MRPTSDGELGPHPTQTRWGVRGDEHPVNGAENDYVAEVED